MRIQIASMNPGPMTPVRALSIFLMAVGFIGIGFCVFENATTGQIVAASDMYSHDAASVRDYFTDWRKNALLLGGETKKQWIASSPVKLSPDDGPLELGLQIAQNGIVQTNSWFLHNPEFVLIDSKTKKEVFHKNGASERESTKILTNAKKIYKAGKVMVPEAGEYVFMAGFNQRDLASSNITVKFQVLAHVWDPDVKFVVLFVGCVAAGVVINFLARRDIVPRATK